MRGLVDSVIGHSIATSERWEGLPYDATALATWGRNCRVPSDDPDNRPDRSDSTIRAASRGCRIGGFAFGMLGAVVMGMPHGMFCMGCCAALMLLLFAVAATDLRWVVALALLVTSEKLLPGAKIWRLTIAVGLIAAAAGLVIVGWKAI